MTSRWLTGEFKMSSFTNVSYKTRQSCITVSPSFWIKSCFWIKISHQSFKIQGVCIVHLVRNLWAECYLKLGRKKRGVFAYLHINAADEFQTYHELPWIRSRSILRREISFVCITQSALWDSQLWGYFFGHESEKIVLFCGHLAVNFSWWLLIWGPLDRLVPKHGDHIIKWTAEMEILNCGNRRSDFGDMKLWCSVVVWPGRVAGGKITVVTDGWRWKGATRKFKSCLCQWFGQSVWSEQRKC